MTRFVSRFRNSMKKSGTDTDGAVVGRRYTSREEEVRAPRLACKLNAEMTGVPCSPPDPMATQMAQLLCDSDVDELEEIVRRWIAEAPTGAIRRQYKTFGAKMLELKLQLAEAPVPPTRDDLELALTMMLKLAAQADRPLQR